MKHDWTDEELIEHWTLEPGDYHLLANKRGATRLGFALQLKFFQIAAEFPASSNSVPAVAVSYLAKQLVIPTRCWGDSDWENRTVKFHRTQIREKFGFREATDLDQEAAVTWLASEIVPFQLAEEKLLEELRQYLREWKLEPPTVERINRIVRSAKNRFEEVFTDHILAQLPAAVRDKLFALLEGVEKNHLETTSTAQSQTEAKLPTLTWLRSDPGNLTLETVRDELRKLELLRGLNLPMDLFDSVSPKTAAAFRHRLLASTLR